MSRKDAVNHVGGRTLKLEPFLLRRMIPLVPSLFGLCTALRVGKKKKKRGTTNNI